MDRAEPRPPAFPGLARVYLASLSAALTARLEHIPLLLLCATLATVGDALGRCGYGVDRPALIAGSLVAAIAAWCGPTGRRLGFPLLAGLVASHLAWQVRFAELPDDHLARAASRSPVTVEARLLRDASAGSQRARLLLEVERQRIGDAWQTARGRIQLRLGATQREWHTGTLVRVALRLRRPRNFGNPSEHDYEGYLAVRGIYATAFLADDGRIEVIAPPVDDGWLRLAAWRRRVGRLIDQTLSSPQSDVMAALIIGSDAPLPREIRESFRRAGVSHVLSISGLHVGLVAAAGIAALRWLLARSQWVLLQLNVPKLAVAASLLPVLLYSGIAGSNLATKRAAVMIVVFLGAVIVDRQRHLLVSLAVAALILLARAPGSSLDVSFQLSFVAVLGLGLGLERFWPWWREREEEHLLRLRSDAIARLARPIAVYCAVSISALAATTPLTAYHFNQISLVAPLANAVVVPLLGSVAVVLGLVAALLVPLSEVAATIPLYLAGPAVWLGIQLTDLCARLPLASLRCVTPSTFELLWVYAVLGCLLWRNRPRRRRLLVLLAAIGLADAAWWYGERFLHRDLRVTFLSVGQGDSTLIEIPGGAVMLIDGGGSFGTDFDTGERVVAPYLWSRKIGRIDQLVLTHPDRDHYGGLRFLAENFSPREWWTNGSSARGDGFAALTEAVASARPIVARAGDSRSLGPVTVEVVSPDTPNAWGDNDASLVLRLRFGERCVLLTGDIQRPAEDALVRAHGAALSCDIVKVPHHGSRSSSSPRFVRSTRASLAVASAGFDNHFHFPNPEVVARYEAVGTRLLRTDLHGAVRVSIAADGSIAVAPTSERTEGHEDHQEMNAGALP